MVLQRGQVAMSTHFHKGQYNLHKLSKLQDHCHTKLNLKVESISDVMWTM